MTLADRIAVMDRGVIRQVGAPAEVYERPGSRFVAGFIGSINMFDGEVAADGVVDVPALGGHVSVSEVQAAVGTKVAVAVRPEKVMLSHERPPGPNAIQGAVKDLAYFGKDSLFRVALASGQLVQVNCVNTSRDGSGRAAEWGDHVWISFAPSAAIVLKD
jgi:putrescine transport system ATP-binding protein